MKCKHPVLKIVIIAWLVLATLYFVWGEYSHLKNVVYRNGVRSAVLEVIQQAQECKAFPVTIGDQGVQLLNVAELVPFLDGKFSKWTIYELVRRRKIPFIKIEGRIYFQPKSITNWLESLETETLTKQETVTVQEIRRLK